MYIQSNFNSSWDVFHFTLSDKQNILSGQRVNVSVKARITQHEPAVLKGEQLVLSTEILDAKELAMLTNSDPVFTITKPSRFGDVMKVISPPRRPRRRDRNSRTK